jgi:hypothetical protein
MTIPDNHPVTDAKIRRLIESIPDETVETYGLSLTDKWIIINQDEYWINLNLSSLINIEFSEKAVTIVTYEAHAILFKGVKMCQIVTMPRI